MRNQRGPGAHAVSQGVCCLGTGRLCAGLKTTAENKHLFCGEKQWGSEGAPQQWSQRGGYASTPEVNDTLRRGFQ